MLWGGRVFFVDERNFSVLRSFLRICLQILRITIDSHATIFVFQKIYIHLQ